ncbi:hypothetical protein B0T14DRAFT_122457 [Immersiella caudata]|uniref:Uncharacterized protein n=1 Tax=Immersiella caudata TaxID=314043 RepID=A0AA39X4R4_9PEZI|nr:hypothetical protein B0T14DRAFT_122457 [Immersiella caudata]
MLPPLLATRDIQPDSPSPRRASVQVRVFQSSRMTPPPQTSDSDFPQGMLRTVPAAVGVPQHVAASVPVSGYTPSRRVWDCWVPVVDAFEEQPTVVGAN